MNFVPPRSISRNLGSAILRNSNGEMIFLNYDCNHIIDWSDDDHFAFFVNDQWLVNKLCLGLIQSWMIFKIALRIRRTYT